MWHALPLSAVPTPVFFVTCQVFIEAYPEPTRQLNYKKLNLKKFDPGAIVRYDGHFHLVSDPIRKPGSVFRYAEMFRPQAEGVVEREIDGRARKYQRGAFVDPTCNGS